MQIRTQGNLVSARPFALLSSSIEARWNHDNGGSVEQAANDVTSRKELVVDIVGAKALKRRLGPTTNRLPVALLSSRRPAERSTASARVRARGGRTQADLAVRDFEARRRG